MVDEETKALIAEQLELISTTARRSPDRSTAQDGTLLFEDGEVAGYDEIEGRNTAFVEGVVGDIPQG